MSNSLPTYVNRLRGEVETLLPLIRSLESVPCAKALARADHLKKRVASLLSDLPASEKGFEFARWAEVVEEEGFFRNTQKDKIRFDLPEGDVRALTSKERREARRISQGKWAGPKS